MVKLFGHLFFFMPAIIMAAKFQNYSPDSLIVKFDKSKKEYMKYQIPAQESLFTREIREVHFLGQVFPDSDIVKISPSPIAAPKTPFEAVSNFLFFAISGEKEKMLELHDESSRPWIDSMLKVGKNRQNFFGYWKDAKSIEIKAVFETPYLIIVFYKNIKGDPSYFRTLYFVKSHGVYKKKGGDFNIGFMQNLQGMLRHADSSVIYKK